MPRGARIVVPEMPHHVVQRGNRKQQVFFTEGDFEYYLYLLEEQARKNAVRIWAYCLMSNHVHLIAVPEDKEGLTRTMAITHRLYTLRINKRFDWKGFLWQGRFSSFPMNEKYLVAAIRYVERNPVRAGLVDKAEDYLYSSAKAHIHRSKDPLLSHCYLLDEIRNWSEFLQVVDNEELTSKIKKHSITGRRLEVGTH